METEYEIIDSRTNEPLSVEDRLRNAQSGEEIQSLLTIGNNARPSGATRRRWLRVAAQSYARIREAQARPAQDVSSPAGNDESSSEAAVHSENLEKTEGKESLNL